MNDWQWKKKESLSEQLKFFGAKKQKFISVYAKKPRIRVEVKTKPDESNVTYIDYNDSRSAYIDMQMEALRQHQESLGMRGVANTAAVGLGALGYASALSGMTGQRQANIAAEQSRMLADLLGSHTTTYTL